MKVLKLFLLIFIVSTMSVKCFAFFSGSGPEFYLDAFKSEPWKNTGQFVVTIYAIGESWNLEWKVNEWDPKNKKYVITTKRLPAGSVDVSLSTTTPAELINVSTNFTMLLSSGGSESFPCSGTFYGHLKSTQSGELVVSVRKSGSNDAYKEVARVSYRSDYPSKPAIYNDDAYTNYERLGFVFKSEDRGANNVLTYKYDVFDLTRNIYVIREAESLCGEELLYDVEVGNKYKITAFAVDNAGLKSESNTLIVEIPGYDLVGPYTTYIGKQVSYTLAGAPINKVFMVKNRTSSNVKIVNGGGYYLVAKPTAAGKAWIEMDYKLPDGRVKTAKANFVVK